MEKAKKNFHNRRYSEFKPVLGLYIDDSIEQYFNKFNLSLTSFYESISSSNLQFSNSFRILNLNTLMKKNPMQSLGEKIEQYIYQKTKCFLSSDFVESFKYYNEQTTEFETFDFNKTVNSTEWSDHILSLIYKSPRLEQSNSKLSFYDLPRHLLTITQSKPDLDLIFQSIPTFEKNSIDLSDDMTNIYVEFNGKDQITIYKMSTEREILFRGSLNDCASKESQNFFKLFEEYFFYETNLRDLKPLPDPLFHFLFNFTKSLNIKLIESVQKAIKRTNEEMQANSNQSIKNFFTSREKKAELKMILNNNILRIAFDYLSINQFKESSEMLNKLPPTFNFYSNLISFHFLLNDQISSENNEIIEMVRDGLIKILKCDLCTNEISMYLLMKTVDFITIHLPTLSIMNDLLNIVFMPEFFNGVGFGVIKAICLEKMALTIISNGQNYRKAAFYFHLIPIVYNQSPLQLKCIEKAIAQFNLNKSLNTSNQNKISNENELNTPQSNRNINPIQDSSNISNSISSLNANLIQDSSLNTIDNSITQSTSDSNISINSNLTNQSNSTNSSKPIKKSVKNDYNLQICGHSLFSSCIVHKLLTLHLNPKDLFIVGDNNVEILTNNSNQFNQIILPWHNLIDFSIERVADLLKEINQAKFVPLIYLNLFASIKSEQMKNSLMINFFDCYNQKQIDKALLKRTTLPFLKVVDVSFDEYGTSNYFNYDSSLFDLLHEFWLSKNQKTSFYSIWTNDKDSINHIPCNKPIKLRITVKCISQEVPLFVEDFTIDPTIYSNTNTSTFTKSHSTNLYPYNDNILDTNNDSQLSNDQINDTQINNEKINNLKLNDNPISNSQIIYSQNNDNHNSQLNNFNYKDLLSEDYFNCIECNSTTLHFNNSLINGNKNKQIASIDFTVQRNIIFDIHNLKFSFWGLSNMKINMNKKKLIFEAHDNQPFIKIVCRHFPKTLSNGEIADLVFQIKNKGDGPAKNVSLIHFQSREISFIDSSKVKNKYLYPSSTSSYSIVPIADILNKGECINLNGKLIGTKNDRTFYLSFFYLAPDPIGWRYFDLSFDVKQKETATFQNKIMSDPRDTSKMIVLSNIFNAFDRKFLIQNAIVGNTMFELSSLHQNNRSLLNSNKNLVNSNSNTIGVNPISTTKNEVTLNAPDLLNSTLNDVHSNTNLVHDNKLDVSVTQSNNESSTQNQSELRNLSSNQADILDSIDSLAADSITSNKVDSIDDHLIEIDSINNDKQKVSFVLTESDSNLLQSNSMFINPNQMIGKVQYELTQNQKQIKFESFIYKNKFTSFPFSFKFIDVPNLIELKTEKFKSIPIIISIKRKPFWTSAQKVLITSHFFPNGSGAFWAGKEANKSLEVCSDDIRFCFQLLVTRTGIIDIGSALRVKIGLVDSPFPFSHYIRII